MSPPFRGINRERRARLRGGATSRHGLFCSSCGPSGRGSHCRVGFELFAQAGASLEHLESDRQKTRTDVLARALDGRFFHGRNLEDIDDRCRFVINAANLVTGVRFAFERDVLGDYVVGLALTKGTGTRVATAVAASAAVPGAFAPLPVQGIAFPCAHGEEPLLVDGGTYDNTGLEAFDSGRYRDVSISCGIGEGAPTKEDRNDVGRQRFI